MASADFPLTGSAIASPNPPERLAAADLNADGAIDPLGAGGGEVRTRFDALLIFLGFGRYFVAWG